MTEPGRRPGNKTRVRIHSVDAEQRRRRSDYVATEEPLEIRVRAGNSSQTVAVTMRTPGADFELAAGFLYGEGIVRSRGEIGRIAYCTDRDLDPAQLYNVVQVRLEGANLPDLRALERHFYTTSACGVCGKSSLDALEMRGCRQVAAGPVVEVETLFGLAGRLREAQGLFDVTGGLHAAGLFTAEGELLCVREDVGRHNAVDKLIGWALLEGHLPLSDRILMLSGRSSFEILQKSVAAGVPVVCAVSAPSSLAISVARRFGLTLVGFLRGERFNVYAGEQRIDAVGSGGEPAVEGRRGATMQIERAT